MSSGFDWRTDEQKGWDEPLPPDSAAKKRLKRLKPGQFIIGFVILLVVLILISFFIQKRLVVKLEQMQADVLTSHQLIIDAVVGRDADQFISMLSDNSVAWRELQEEVLRHQLILSRKPFGLKGPIPISATTELSPTQVILSDQLDRAEVKQIFLYEVQFTADFTKTVRLEQLFQYELVGNSWLLTDVDKDTDFWGSWHRIEGDWLTLAYPERDANIAARFSDGLDALLSVICNDGVVNCPDDFHLVIRLDPSLRTMLRLQDGPFASTILSGYGPETISLPAPSIVGRPVDADGYDALYQGYASWLASTMYTNYAPDKESIDESMLAEQMTDWGFEHVPLPDPPLPDRVHPSFPADVVPPEQDIMMLCANVGLVQLLQYRFADGEWINRSVRTYPGQNLAFSGYPIADLSRPIDYDGAIYVIQESAPEGAIWRIFLWRDGVERLLVERDETVGFWPAIVQPDMNSPENDFIFYQLNVEDSERLVEFRRIPILDCLEGNCQLERSNGLLFYSPSRENTLIIEPAPNDQLKLYRGDQLGRAVQFLGIGRSSTWLNNDTYAFLLSMASPDELNGNIELGPGLIEGRISTDNNVDNDVFEVIVTAERLRMAIPRSDRPDHLFINNALVSEDLPEHWYIIANSDTNTFDGAAYIFRYERDSGTIKLLQSNKGQAFDYSTPAGHADRYLGYLTFDGIVIRYMLLDTNSDTVKEYGLSQPSDRSADGAWFLFTEAKALRIASPEYGYDWTLNHNLPSCHDAVWINRE